ncbi:RNA binding protein, putative [Leishmania donovani]|uniref:RNA binding protein, putative n=1 Tax=Leishmania donovani TaxID=5661 RepID=A0A3Q8IET1_LEIDO|nr:RNA binding protein, putative [Leishmania donovani]
MSSARSEGSERSPDEVPSPMPNTAPLATVALADSIGVDAPPAASLLTAICNSTQIISNVSVSSSHTSMMRLSRAEVLARTVHLRCLPPFMKQRILADVFEDCGEYLRVRICGNAATHQKWVYGFVEFATKDAAAKMTTYCGMELPNGPDKPPLRLKCSPSKQPILDCMAYDADVANGTPCGFGRGHLAECTLNDVLLVVGSGSGTPKPSTAGGASSSGGGRGGGGVGDRRMKAANSALTALAVQSIRKVAATGCGCGCSGVNCCGCCSCWKGLPESTECASCAGGEVSSDISAKGTAGAVGAPVAARGCADCATCDGGSAMATHPSDCCGDAAATLPQLKATCSGLLDLQMPFVFPGGGSPLDFMQQLAAAFQGLRDSAATHESQLDGPSIARRAEAMALDAMHRSGRFTSDACIQDTLSELTQLLAFLDSNRAVTGGAAQTASGDCTATVPQRVTQLWMLAHLVSALLCVLRRRVGDAIPHVEAVLVTFAQTPPSTLLLRARQRGKAVAVQEQRHAEKLTHSQVLGALHEGRGPGAVAGAATAIGAPAACSLVKRRFAPSLPLGSFVDEDVAGSLLEMVNEDGDYDGSHCEDANIHRMSSRDDPLDNDDIEDKDDDAAQLKDSSGSASSCTYASEAFWNSADTAALCRRDESFSRYVLNVLVSVGLAMEEVHPGIARSAYMLANGRATEVLGEPSKLLADRLAAAPTGNPHLCAALFAETDRNGSARDVTFFPHQFFESVNVVSQRLLDIRETEGFWRQLPPNHIVTLFNA